MLAVAGHRPPTRSVDLGNAGELVACVTYESFAGAWPNYRGEFADKMNGMPKVVVSSTLTDPAWNNTTVLGGDVVEGVTEPWARDGGPIPGSRQQGVGPRLLDDDLVDELRLMVFPVTTGSGLRVFPETAKETSWELANTEAFPSGVRVDTYRPA